MTITMPRTAAINAAQYAALRARIGGGQRPRLDALAALLTEAAAAGTDSVTVTLSDRDARTLAMHRPTARYMPEVPA